MSRYIDSEAFFKVINTLPYKDTSYPDASVYNGAISDVADMLTHFPAADVQEVRHGKWTTERTIEHDGEMYCDQCGWTWENLTFDRTKVKRSPFCPNCGAKMDEVEK